MKTKWASLSVRGNITVNKLAKYLPDHLIKYIVYHEVAHMISRRHDEMFYKILSTFHFDVKHLEEQLFKYWFAIMHHPE